MTNTADMTPQQKIEFLEDQIQSVKDGQQSAIFCPYCGTKNSRTDANLCCKLFSEASAAILTRMEQIEAMEFMQRAHDNATRRIH
jgi:predicted RNA methylase